MMDTVRKIWKFLSSMQFAIILLVVLALACAAGSFVTQGQSYEWYAARYSERTAALIVALSLDDAFHSWWFIAINAFLVLNLLLCNVIRLPQLIERTKAEADPAKANDAAATVKVEGVSDPDAVFAALHMPKAMQTERDGKAMRFSSKNRIGLWGAWVCHLGILLLILGFSLGQFTKTEYVAYGVAGQTRAIGDTGLYVTIDDFRVELREDDTVAQYIADITVFRAPQGSTTQPDEQSATISVNNPAKLFGMTFYQNSTGWAARINVKKDGVPLQSEVVCAGDALPITDMPGLRVIFMAFYPDYVLVPGVGPQTQSGSLNNPAYLYAVYYLDPVTQTDRFVGMNVLLADEPLTIDEYEVTFTEPQSYTLLQIKRDRFTGLALAGGIVTTLGLVLAFYLLPEKVWAVQDADGTWTMCGQSKKGGALYRERFKKAAPGATESKETEE